MTLKLRRSMIKIIPIENYSNCSEHLNNSYGFRKLVYPNVTRIWKPIRYFSVPLPK